MIQHKDLIYLYTQDGMDVYRFKARPFKWFIDPPMAYYEKYKTRKLREAADFIRGKYLMLYFAVNDELVGHATITKGGGMRNRFCSSKDAVVGNIWIQEEHRGKGYGKIFYRITVRECEKMFTGGIYCYIRVDNEPSKRCAEVNGFDPVGRVSRRGIFKSNVPDENGKFILYKK